MAQQKICLECGQTHERGPRATFCSHACKMQHGNRRRQRGALLYDLWMEHRYNRGNDAGTLTIMANLARAFRDADNHFRDGRVSWDKDTPKRIPNAFGKAGDKR